MDLAKQIREYLEREAQRPLPSSILIKLADLRNAETRRKRAMYPPRRVVKRRTARQESGMTDRNEKLRGYANEFIGMAKQLFGEALGSQKTFDEGQDQQAKGETQVEWGKAKAAEEEKPHDPLKDTR